jgi:thiol-disulfide isomerase/thioredoxin
MQDIASGADVTIVPTGTPMVINFWYSTCAPCIRELPALSEAAEKYGDRVQFIGVNPNDSRDVAQSFLKNLDIKFASYIDDGDQLSAVEVATFPTTYFLNADGVIVKMQSGELKPEDIESNSQRRPRSRRVIALEGDFAYSFILGVLAAVNPCGFILLPTYLLYYLGTELNRDEESPRGNCAAVDLLLELLSPLDSLGFSLLLGLFHEPSPR